MAESMAHAPLTQPTPGAQHGSNHPLWTLGHLCVIEGDVRHILLGEPSPVEHWKPLFAAGTKPTTDVAAYPSFDEVLSTYRELRAQNLKLLEHVGEAGLDRAPKHVPPGFETMMTSAGNTLLLIALHNMFHSGQIADARRAAGLKPRF
jgi:uncharacterized damage-inducible protein DinB